MNRTWSDEEKKKIIKLLDYKFKEEYYVRTNKYNEITTFSNEKIPKGRIMQSKNMNLSKIFYIKVNANYIVSGVQIKTNNSIKIYGEDLVNIIRKKYDYKNNKLFYKLCNQEKEIISSKEELAILKSKWYNKNCIAFLSSGMNLYNYIREKYIGISRKACTTFVHNQEVWQLKRITKKHKISHPIVKKYPNELWSIDLIDFQKYANFNRHKKWILVIVDHFSKFAWLISLKSKARSEIIPQLQQLIKKEAVPDCILSDNEFRDKEMQRFYKENNIIGRTSLPYTPQQNGAAERFIRTIKSKIFKYMRFSKRYIDILDNVVYSYNNQVHSTTGYKPVEVYRFGTQGIFDDIYFNTRKKAKAMKDRQQKQIIEKQIKKRTSGKLQKGDYVRINVNIDTEKTKTPSLKTIYSEAIYTIKKVDIENNRYQLNKQSKKKQAFWNENEQKDEKKDFLIFAPIYRYESYENYNIGKYVDSITWTTDTGVNIEFQKNMTTFKNLEYLNSILNLSSNLIFQKSTNYKAARYILMSTDIKVDYSKYELVFVFLTAEEIENVNLDNIDEKVQLFQYEYTFEDKKWYRDYELLKLPGPPDIIDEIIITEKEKVPLDLSDYDPVKFTKISSFDDFVEFENKFWMDMQDKSISMEIKENIKQKIIAYDDKDITLKYIKEFINRIKNNNTFKRKRTKTKKGMEYQNNIRKNKGKENKNVEITRTRLKRKRTKTEKGEAYQNSLGNTESK